MALNVKKTVLAYAGIAFILLGVLFGMNIMTFIFGSLGPDAAGFTQTAGTVTNLTGTYINATVYTVPEATVQGFGTFAVTQARNSTSGLVIAAGNYTVDAAAGTITNATAVVWNAVDLDYTYNYDAGARLASVNIQNDSLNSIQTYSNASGTQFSTISIAIILAVLISLFLLFWTFFMGGGGTGNKSSGNFS